MTDDATWRDLTARPAAEQLTGLRRMGLDGPDGLSELVDRAAELVHDEPSTSEALCRLGAAAAEEARLPAISARSCYLHARICSERGDFAAALDLIERARAHWMAAGEITQAWRTDLGRMAVLDDLGRHVEAAEVGRALVAALDAPDPPCGDADLRQWLRAAALENVGVAAGYLGGHEEALAAYRRAEQVYATLGMADDERRTRANSGVELLELGHAARALAVLRDATASFDDAGDRLWAAKCRGFVAQALQQAGRHIEALRILETARAELDRLGAEPEAVRLQIATAGIYLSIGLAEEALGEARAAAERATAVGMRHDSAAASLVTGLAHLRRGRPALAAETLSLAETELAAVGDVRQLARVRTAQADLCTLRGDARTAVRLLAEVTAVLDEGGWPAPLAWVLLRRVDLGDDPDGAMLDRAARLGASLQLPLLDEACRLRTARRHRRNGRPEAAEAVLREVVDRGAREHQQSAELVPYAVPDPDRRAAHDELVDLVLATGGPGAEAEAWEISRRAKARTLLDVTDSAVGPATAGAAEQELRRVRDRLDATYTDLLRRPLDGRADLRLQAEALERQISVLRLRAAVAEHRATPAGPHASLAPPPGATILAYHLLGDDVLAFVPGPDGPRVERLDGILPRVEAELRRLGAQWTRFRAGPEFSQRRAGALTATARAILRALDELLLAPLRRSGLLDPEGDLLVFPDGRLHHVPFQALHDGTAYLLERRGVAVLSANGWPVTTRDGAPLGPPLVLAVPDARAPSVAAEAAAIAEFLPDARVRVGAAATAGVLAAVQAPPRILHFACHGLFRPANPLFSALRLADRWLTALEVLDLDLAGALVTLSACESGRHGVASVDPVGLAWAFLAAGARGVVVSQWVVHDAVAVELMSGFYRALRAGYPPPVALRAAQLAVAATRPHPFFWAPFTLVLPPSPYPQGDLDA